MKKLLLIGTNEELGTPLRLFETNLSHLLQAICDQYRYDSIALVELLESQNCRTVIPSKRNAKHPRTIDSELYKERFLVEALFSKLKHFRRVFARFDKTTSAFAGFLHLAGALIGMR